MSAYDNLLFPIAWATASVTAALLLYRTSNSTIGEMEIAGIALKKLSLAGSVVIAVIFFVLLQNATQALISRDTIPVRRGDFLTMLDSAKRLEVSLADANACVTMASGNFLACKENLSNARTEAVALRQGLESAGGGADR